MDYSADGKIRFISPIVLSILWFQEVRLRKERMEGIRASAKGREGKVSQILMNYPIKEIVCRDLAIASSGMTIYAYPASFERRLEGQ